MMDPRYCSHPNISRTDRCLDCGTMLDDKSGVSSKAQDNHDNGALKLDKYSDQLDRPRNVMAEAKEAFPGDLSSVNPALLLSLDAYKLRKKLAVDTTRAQMELMVSNLLDDIRADCVKGFVVLVELKDGQPRVEAGGQMTCASALWLGQMIINKVGPN